MQHALRVLVVRMQKEKFVYTYPDAIYTLSNCGKTKQTDVANMANIANISSIDRNRSHDTKT